MMLKLKNSLMICLVLLSFITMAQEFDEYKYQRELLGVHNQWHKIIIPNDIYSKINRDFSDLRIVGVTEDRDTIEAPFILNVITDEVESKSIKFELINQVSNTAGYYYTFKTNGQQFVNEIDLEIEQTNFDWQVNLEGSQDQKEWFTILDQERILSIQNDFTSYHYSSLKFNRVRYNYFRLLIPTSGNPELKDASIKNAIYSKGEYLLPGIKSQKVHQDEDKKNTELIIEFEIPSPISYVKLNVDQAYDFYRPLIIQYAIDSVESNSGWKYVYSTIYSTTFSSLDKREYKFPNKVMKRLKLIIKNGDNEPLDYQKSEVRGDVHELYGRFDETSTYYLFYGNPKAYVPNYDITRFETKIPPNLAPLEVGDEVLINIEESQEEQGPLITNNMWLWTIMIIVISILGYFTVSMLKDK